MKYGMASPASCPAAWGYENCGTEDEGVHYRGEASGSTAYHQRTSCGNLFTTT